MRDVLTRVRNRLDAKSAWCQVDSARRADGKRTHTTDPDATAWCLMGAIYVEARNAEAFIVCRRLLLDVTEAESLSLFNDTATHRRVLKALDAAIARCAS